MGPTTPGPDSKPKEGGIPDIMRGIGNMLRIAILEYNYKAYQKELTKVLNEIIELKSGNAVLQAKVDGLTQELQNATRRLNDWYTQYRNVFGELQNANHANTQLLQHLQDLQGTNTQLGQRLQGARDNIAALEQRNQGLQVNFGNLQQQLHQVQQETQQQNQQLERRLQQQLQQEQAETAAARAEAAAARIQAQAAADTAATDVAAAQQQAQERAQEAAAAAAAQAAAEARVIAAETAQHQARERVADLEAQLGQLQTQQGASADQVRGLETELETTRGAARDAADDANQAQAEAVAARAEAEAAQAQAVQANQARADAVAAAQAAQADAERQARAASETAQQSVIEKEAEAAQERVRLGSMVEDAERERDAERNAAAAARAQITAAHQAVTEATAQADASAAQVRDLQNQLAQKEGLSQGQLDDLNRQLDEAVRKAAADKAAVQAANVALRKQLDQQARDAQVAAEAAAIEQQRLTVELADLQGRASTTGNQNEGLRERIADVERQLAEANDAAEQRRQEAGDAQLQFQTQLEHVRAAADAKVAKATQTVEELRSQLNTLGTENTAQRAALEKQLQEQRQEAEEARRVQQDAVQRAEVAERASEDTKKQITQQKVANTLMSAAVETARKEAQEATQRAEDARKVAEERVAQKQSELDTLQQQLETAKRTGKEVDTLKQTLAAKEFEVNSTKKELEAQKLAQAAEVKAAEEKAEAAKAEAAQQVAAAEAAKKAAEAAKTESENIKNTLLERHGKSVDVLNESTEENKKLKSELDELKKKLAELTAAKEDEKQLQQDTDRTEKQKKFTVDKAALQARVTDAISKIEKMTDATCKDQLLTTAKQIEIEVNDLTLETFGKTSDLDKKVQDLSEATGDKIKTFVSMRKEENPHSITFDKTKKTVTIPAITGGGPTKVWGPFSGVFDHESTNQLKYQSMKADLLDDIPSKGTTVVIFGYGYSGSGKTYTLLGGYKKDGTRENGIAQLAIQGYIAAKCTVQMEEVFEMYNDSYTNSDGFDYGTEIPKKEDIFDSKLPLVITSTSDFDGAYSKITIKRKSKGRITATPNNGESSRGHLFIVLKVTKDGKEGRLIICDMGGRENPNEMWTNSEYVTITKNNPNELDMIKQTYTVIRPVLKSNPEMYYDEDGTEKLIPTTTHPPQKKKLQQLFGLGTSTLAMALQGKSSSPEKTMLKQGFYINDSINEMLAEFGYKSVESDSNWSKGVYNPAVRALLVAGLNKKTDGKVYNKKKDHIGIHELFQGFREKSKCKIKFCTFACIRSPAVFFEDSIKTLQFAEAVNSVILAAPSRPTVSTAAPAPAPSSLPPAPADDARSFGGPRNTNSQLVIGPNGLTSNATAKTLDSGKLSQQPPTSSRRGGSIRRQRRKKHAIFKTLKKDSALASDSNSVKVKHKTRNKKKHNTRNNTVKK